jgi:hypothetical protein
MIIDYDLSKQLVQQNGVSGRLSAPSISLQLEDNTFANLMANLKLLLRKFDCSKPKCKIQIYTYFLLHNLMETVINESVKMFKLIY